MWTKFGTPTGAARLAAVTALQAYPGVERLDWLADRVLNDGQAFISYHAAVGLLAAANDLPEDDLPAVDRWLRRIGMPFEPQSGRGRALTAAREAVERRLSGRSAAAGRARGGRGRGGRG
jgi:hypothetical protein